MRRAKPLSPQQIFENNRRWVDRTNRENPSLINNLAQGQHPDYLWIGCSDSRVPPDVITGLEPGCLFEHRNIANMVVHTDLNLLSVMEYAIKVLKVKHIIICGHYGCGGVSAVFKSVDCSNIHNWLLNIKDVELKHREELAAIEDEAKRIDRLCELNVEAQVEHVTQTLMVQKAWKEGQDLTIHGWIYDLETGLLNDLGIEVSGAR